MLYFIDYLSDFFGTVVGTYWIKMYIGCGVAMCFLIILDNIRN